MKMRVVSAWPCAALAVVLCAPVAEADVIIDDFTTGGPYYGMLDAPGSRVDQLPGGMLGGECDLGYQITENPFDQELEVFMADTLGLAAVATGPGVTGHVALDYDGMDTETGELPFVKGPGLGSLDWTELDQFLIQFMFVDMPIAVQVMVQSFDEIGEITGTSMLEREAEAGEDVNLELSFADFVGDANFGDVDRLIFRFNSDERPARDFVLRGMEAVPSPGALALLALAGVLAGRRRR